MKYRFFNIKLPMIKQLIMKGLAALKQYYAYLNQKPKLVWGVGGTLIVILLIAMLINITSSNTKKVAAYPVHFDSQSSSIKPSAAFQLKTNSQAAQANTAQLQRQLSTTQRHVAQQYSSVQQQLQNIQSNLSGLASQQDISSLQTAISRPNQAILGKVDGLQNAVKRIIQQTAKKVWVKPQSVTQYFQLVAVQGFSDGMRAIIDVNGNQLALSLNEICPACRGWVLKSMDFSNQSAVFEKRAHNQMQYVKLQAN